LLCDPPAWYDPTVARRAWDARAFLRPRRRGVAVPKRAVMNVIDLIEKEQQKDAIPAFRSGDTVKVYSRVVEGGKERTQMFEGIVTVRKGGGSNESITVRRVAHGVGVERTFLLHSPRLERIEVSKRGVVRRSRLYYLSEKVGKAARVKEKKAAR
jgi:large subunit ribosomal protein L19